MQRAAAASVPIGDVLSALADSETRALAVRRCHGDRDISGSEFKFGSIVMPGHRGLWSEPIRTGSWLLNPRCHEPTIVPTRILTLDWADNVNAAGELDKNLKTITAKSKDGFEFKVELQVPIHISDVRAPRVISMVGSVENLVNQVLQSAVGNYFRNKIQSMLRKYPTRSSGWSPWRRRRKRLVCRTSQCAGRSRAPGRW